MLLNSLCKDVWIIQTSKFYYSYNLSILCLACHPVVAKTPLEIWGWGGGARIHYCVKIVASRFVIISVDSLNIFINIRQGMYAFLLGHRSTAPELGCCQIDAHIATGSFYG